MPGFAMFETATWEDGPFLRLGADARLLFIWSWTNPHATICGLYEASLERIALALPGLPDEGERPLTEQEVQRLDTALVELAAKPLVVYHYETRVLYVPKRAAKANRSPKVLTAMQREFARCPQSPCKEMFAARYPRIANPEED